ncbi:MAG: FAD:protein FMN transferase [Candidatus Limnocylindrales bacterium]
MNLVSAERHERSHEWPAGLAREGRTPRDVSAGVAMMGGLVAVHLRLAPLREGGPGDAARAQRDANHVLRRVAAWAARLTRFSITSELARLNADRGGAVPAGPTLTAVLDWGRAAEAATGGMVDIALLDARLAAEGLAPAAPANPAASRAWSLERRPRGALVHRPAGLRFDLDGVAKGWLADRALRLLPGYPGVAIDADGDLAIRLAAGERWRFSVADPRTPGAQLAVLELAPGRYGLATSGTSVHRWLVDGTTRHHLVDPRTGRSATTDVVQATVLAGSAREAEALAKAAVIAGSAAALDLLERPAVLGALLLTHSGALLATPATMRWLV